MGSLRYWASVKQRAVRRLRKGAPLPQKVYEIPVIETGQPLKKNYKITINSSRAATGFLTLRSEDGRVINQPVNLLSGKNALDLKIDFIPNNFSFQSNKGVVINKFIKPINVPALSPPPASLLRSILNSMGNFSK